MDHVLNHFFFFSLNRGFRGRRLHCSAFGLDFQSHGNKSHNVASASERKRRAGCGRAFPKNSVLDNISNWGPIWGARADQADEGSPQKNIWPQSFRADNQT